eukprot:7026828-Alexandrium_andersonii.AAC.1
MLPRLVPHRWRQIVHCPPGQLVLRIGRRGVRQLPRQRVAGCGLRIADCKAVQIRPGVGVHCWGGGAVVC